MPVPVNPTFLPTKCSPAFPPAFSTIPEPSNPAENGGFEFEKYLPAIYAKSDGLIVPDSTFIKTSFSVGS